MVKIFLKWLLSACALLLTAGLYGGVALSSFGSALGAALLIGLLNLFLRPALVLLTLPATLLTLGLFLFVINALLFWAASALLQGFHVQNFAAALWGSLIYSALGLMVDLALERLFPQL